MQQIKIILLLIPAMLLPASEGVCGSISVCDGRYEIPLFVDAGAKTISEADSCGAVIYSEGGNGSQKYIQYLYGFLSYKEVIHAEQMQRFQNFVANFVNRASGHGVGEFKAVDPIFSKIPGTDVYKIVQKFDQVYGGVRFSGVYEIMTKVEGDRTNSYFIEYPDESGLPGFYDRFRRWALR